jgi:hypothetical protein
LRLVMEPDDSRVRVPLWVPAQALWVPVQALPLWVPVQALPLWVPAQARQVPRHRRRRRT